MIQDVSRTLKSAQFRHPAVTVCPDDPVKTAARLMQKHRLQRLPVADRDGHLVGIVRLVRRADRLPPQ